MSQKHRLEQIMDLIQASGFLTTEQLVEEFGVVVGRGRHLNVLGLFVVPHQVSEPVHYACERVRALSNSGKGLGARSSGAGGARVPTVDPRVPVRPPNFYPSRPSTSHSNRCVKYVTYEYTMIK